MRKNSETFLTLSMEFTHETDETYFFFAKYFQFTLHLIEKEEKYS